MNPRFHKIVRVAKGVAIRNGIVSRSRRTAIIKFSAKFGFVYFGHVDQHDDEHHVIRGLTASSSHQDEHYSVGSFDGYDVSLVDRYDIISHPTRALRTHRWLIFEIDLHNGKDLPHVFLGGHSSSGTSYEKLFTSLPSLQPVPLGTFGMHSDEFTKRYSFYAAATQFIEVEKIFSVEITRTIAAHFWPLSVELYEGSLFIYSDNKTVSGSLLETMLKNGLWLAAQIDERHYPISKIGEN
jgi:hypothetical protein